MINSHRKIDIENYKNIKEIFSKISKNGFKVLDLNFFWFSLSYEWMS